MPIAADFLREIEQLAPAKHALDYDNVGLIVGDENMPVSSVLVCLDVTDEVAENIGGDGTLIVSHHPPIFDPLRSIGYNSVIAKLILKNACVISAHTNFDVCEHSMNHHLCSLLELSDISPIIPTPSGAMVGLKGSLPAPMSADDFAKHIRRAISPADMPYAVKYCGSGRIIKTAGVICGSGGSYLDDAAAEKVDALITGDVKHEAFISAAARKISLFDAGHYHTERFFSDIVARLLRERFPQVPISAADAGSCVRFSL